MKKFLILLFVLVDIVMIIYCINIGNEYDKNNKLLNFMLNGNNYNDKYANLELERDNVLDDIKKEIGINFDGVNTFDGIKNKLNNDYDKLNVEHVELVSKREQLNEQNKTLKKTYAEILAEEEKKNTYMISNVPKINQYNVGYPTGCESAALRNLLKFWGVPVSMKQIVDALPKGDLPYYEDGIRYGGNPYLEFIGHPSSYSSYGVYEKPIMQVASRFKLGIIDGTGMSLDEILSIVKEDRPVIAWVSMNMAVPYVSKSWIYKPTNEKISWMANEHALLVVGYNKNQVIVTDSLNGGIRYYDKNVFKNRYNTYGKRALYY